MSTPSKDPFGPEFVDLLKDIGGIKPEVPGYGAHRCPYCTYRSLSWSDMDHHRDYVHGNHD